MTGKGNYDQDEYKYKSTLLGILTGKTAMKIFKSHYQLKNKPGAIISPYC